MCIPSQSWNYTNCIFSIGVAPAYHTRIRDGIAFIQVSEPSIMLTIYYNFHLSPPKHARQPSKSSIEPWTNNKAFKSRFRSDSSCERFGRAETMEHLLCECKHFSELLWNKLLGSLTQLFNNRSTDLVPRVELGPTNIIYNIPHSLLCYCSVPSPWRPHKVDKRMVLEYTHDLFITWTEFRLATTFIPIIVMYT
jgi:hypothetical protein